MTTAVLVSVSLVVLLLILPALFGLVFDRVRNRRPRLERLMTADAVEARTTLAYYADVRDSHSG